MENRHQKISGYRDLSQTEIDTMNVIKAKAEEIGQLCNDLSASGSADNRWVAIGATHLQQGFMALVRSVAKPTTF